MNQVPKRKISKHAGGHQVKKLRNRKDRSGRRQFLFQSRVAACVAHMKTMRYLSHGFAAQLASVVEEVLEPEQSDASDKGSGDG